MTYTLIAGAIVADGETIGVRPQDVLLANGRIERIAPPGSFDHLGAIPRVDADGLLLAPGFIDTHAHNDHTPLMAEDDTSKIMQGVTTEVNGNCGFSLAPIATDFESDYASLVRRIFPSFRHDWRSFAEYLQELRRGEFVTNFATLLGHNTIRIAAMGTENRQPDEAELQAMEQLVDQALEHGVAGLSTGLIYPPGVFSETPEVVRLTRRLPRDAVYSSHMRNESRFLLRSLAETVEVAEAAGVRCHVSHLKLADLRRAGEMSTALDYLADRRTSGVRITQDIYPYTAASTMLSALVPPWMHDGGSVALLRRLGSAAELERAARDVADASLEFENYALQAGWENVVIASTGSHRFEGESLSSIANRLGVQPVEAVGQILVEEELQATMIVHAMAEEDVRTALADPRTMIGTDGLPAGTGGRPHPRAFGSFPRVLQHYVAEEGVLTLQEAIRRMTALPAEVFGLTGRGRVLEGCSADLVLLSPDDIVDHATFADPMRSPSGVRDVFVNGVRVVESGTWTGRRAGAFLRAGH